MRQNHINSKTRYEITRREFLWLASMSAAGLVTGCAANPVTGKSQFMLVSEDKEIQIDKQNSPHQFSADYGPSQDKALNNYIDQTGKKIASNTHRTHMPYSFRVVNAVYINAYAFPGGSIAATRGILLSLENEGELASLLGHELGHVNSRHTARMMSTSLLTNAVISGISTYAGTKGAAYSKITSQLGMIGAGALLASYSRDNEREADALGLQYMVKTGYNPKGFADLMDMLNTMSRHKTNAMELLFATHPMSQERYDTAMKTIKTRYGSIENSSVFRERYMDNTAKLRKIRGAVKQMQEGENEIRRQRYTDAEAHFKEALTQAPDDYAGLLMMAKCQIAQKKHNHALGYVKKAEQVYPQEAQARHLSGFIRVKQKDYDSALMEFNRYAELLPGNSNTIFFKGVCLEGMGRLKESASHYHKYLNLVNQGSYAKHSYKRLVEWGYIKPQQ